MTTENKQRDWSTVRGALGLHDGDAVSAALNRLEAQAAELEAKYLAEYRITQELQATVLRISEIAQRREHAHEVAADAREKRIAELEEELKSERGLNKRGEQTIGMLREIAHKHGWNGVENSKFLEGFFDNYISELCSKVAELEGEVASAREIQETTEQAMVAQSQSWQCRVDRLEGENARRSGFWLIHFEDNEMPVEIFTDKGDACERFHACQLNWNCHLFEMIAPLNPAEHPDDLISGSSQSKEDLP